MENSNPDGPEGQTQAVQKWADDYMFKAEALDPDAGPLVWLLNCNSDPLGSIAAAAKAYKGEFVKSLAEITDQERRYYLGEVQKTALAMPLETVVFHFRISGVTRGFTHQLVRQRTAAYSQESTRFAVKDTVPVAIPPSLMGSNSNAEVQLYDEFLLNSNWHSMVEEFKALRDSDQTSEDQERRIIILQKQMDITKDSAMQYASINVRQIDRWRNRWDYVVGVIEEGYNYLVNDGMPAEDARGLLPTNLMTQTNYITNLRNFLDEGGKRLCTQAQFEWRTVFAQMMQAIRKFGETQYYTRPRLDGEDVPFHMIWNMDGINRVRCSSDWQFDALAELFKPACYRAGHCTFKADFDRKCSIRGRVYANAEINRASSEWGEEFDQVPNDSIIVGFNGTQIVRTPLGMPAFIPAIRPAEWLLDPGAAR